MFAGTTGMGQTLGGTKLAEYDLNIGGNKLKHPDPFDRCPSLSKVNLSGSVRLKSQLVLII